MIVGLAVLTFTAIVGGYAVVDRFLARHALQVADLCQRLQAPETAVAEHVAAREYEVQHLPFDDDVAWAEHVETR